MEHQQSSSPWPQLWPHQSHSNEVERRLVESEIQLEDHEERLDRHSRRLTWHERAMQAFAVVLWMIVQGSAQGRVPDIADLLLTVLRGAK